MVVAVVVFVVVVMNLPGTSGQNARESGQKQHYARILCPKLTQLHTL